MSCVHRRNLFRMWFLDEPSIAGEKCLNGSGDAFPYRRGADPYFSVKVLAQTPIAIGNREKIQNIMTGETALFIRQAGTMLQRPRYKFCSLVIRISLIRFVQIFSQEASGHCYSHLGNACQSSGNHSSSSVGLTVQHLLFVIPLMTYSVGHMINSIQYSYLGSPVPMVVNSINGLCSQPEHYC